MSKRLWIICVILAMCLPLSAKGKDNTDDTVEIVSEPRAKTDKRGENKKENEDRKTSEYVTISGDIKSTVKLGFVDSNDDSGETNITIAKNRPVFTTEADVSAKLLIFKHDNIIFGPVAYSYIEGKMDHKDVVTKVKYDTGGAVTKVNTKSIFFFEEGKFLNYAGIRIGTTFGKAAFAGSKFTFTVPFMINFVSNDTNDYITVPDNSEEIDYFSHLVLGTHLVAHLQIKSKPYHFGFNLKNSFMFGGDVYSTSVNSLYLYELLWFTVKNNMEFDIKPFNFINGKIDIEFTAAFRSTIEFTGRNLEMKKKAYLGIKWDGLKYFTLGYKPFIYEDEKNYLAANLIDGNYSSYDDYYNFSTEFSVSFGNKYFDVEIAYQLPYWTYDDGSANGDSIREHILTTAVEIKF